MSRKSGAQTIKKVIKHKAKIRQQKHPKIDPKTVRKPRVWTSPGAGRPVPIRLSRINKTHTERQQKRDNLKEDYLKEDYLHEPKVIGQVNFRKM